MQNPKRKAKAPTVLAIIPARGGSKGILGKNIYPLNGKPLIAYTIEASLKSNFITKSIVSSDEDKILEISAFYGASILKRPSIYSNDDSSSEDVIKHVLGELKEKGEVFDITILLQPTSPLRNSEDIDNSIDLMLSKNASSVISVTNIGIKPFKSYYLDANGFLQGVHNNKTPNMRRQELPDAYLANGAIYAIYTKLFLENKSLITNETIPFIMNKEKSYDIDNLYDLNLVEKIMKGELDENS